MRQLLSNDLLYITFTVHSSTIKGLIRDKSNRESWIATYSYHRLISWYRKIACSRPVYCSILNHFGDATNWDVLLLPCPTIKSNCKSSLAYFNLKKCQAKIEYCPNYPNGPKLKKSVFWIWQKIYLCIVSYWSFLIEKWKFYA